LGKRLAALLVPGDILTLSGVMGAGKTVLVSGIAEGLGMASGVSSPTFALVHEYPTHPKLYHFDGYRLESPRAFADAGLEEYFDKGGVCVLEWPDAAADALPPDRLDVLLRVCGDTRRDIFLKPSGETWKRRLERWV